MTTQHQIIFKDQQKTRGGKYWGTLDNLIQVIEHENIMDRLDWELKQSYNNESSAYLSTELWLRFMCKKHRLPTTTARLFGLAILKMRGVEFVAKGVSHE